MRYLPDVLERMIACVPEEHDYYKKGLESIRQSALYAAPEAMYLHWDRTYDFLVDNTTKDIKDTEWIGKIVSIWCSNE